MGGGNSEPAFRAGQVIVKFKDTAPVAVRQSKGVVSASAAKVDAVLRGFGVRGVQRLFPSARKSAPTQRAVKAPDGSTLAWHDLSSVFCLQADSLSADSTQRLVAALDSLPEVDFAEPNYVAYISGGMPAGLASTPRDATAAAPMAPADERAAAYDGRLISPQPARNPYYLLQKGLLYEGLPELWTKPVVNKRRPVIAILDTGVDINHPDLKDNIWTNTAEAEGEPDYDNDGNGFKGDVHGWDFINNSPTLRDYNMHGTHCAGIAAAADNNLGIIGANPQALIMPVTVMQSDGTGDYATIARGIDYAVANGATVLSMSLGGYANSRTLRYALENAYHSCVLVAAAGNDGLAIYRECDPLRYGACYPAAYSFVLGVQATGDFGGLAGFSNYDCDGPNYSAETTLTDPEGINYELMAPGVRILSTVPNGKYAYLSGTSMAAPLVAGAISALQMVKSYASQEELWGDLTHSGNVLEAYNTSDRPAELDFLGMQLRDRRDLKDGEIDDNAYATNDGQADAGETLSIWPMLRTTFGAARGVKLQLQMGDEYEDSTLVEILTPQVDFGLNLSAYGKGVSLNPLQVKIASTCPDARHIKLKVVASAEGTSQTFEQPFTLTVSNLHKIGGLIDRDSTLTADKTWYVTDNLGIMKGATLTIEPGTRLEFAEGARITSFGRLIARGTPRKPIIFTLHTGENYYWAGVISHASEGEHSYTHNFGTGYIYHNADSTKFTLRRTEETPYRLSDLIHSYVYFGKYYYYDPDQSTNPGKSFNLASYIDQDEKIAQLKRDTTLVYDPNFITPEVLKLLADYRAWDDTCKAKYNTSVPDVTTDFHNNINYYLNLSWTDVWYDNPIDTIEYCILKDFCNYSYAENLPIFNNCLLQESVLTHFIHGTKNNLVSVSLPGGNKTTLSSYSNILNYSNLSSASQIPTLISLSNCNYFNVNHVIRRYNIGNIDYWLANTSSTPTVDHADYPPYLGTAREDLVRPHCYEMGNGSNGFGKIDLSNMRKEPVHEAHGIVWKVVVDGKDAQDEYEDLPPLGVGRHEFCVWFNRPMNVEVAPSISFGVRDPYTQVAVADSGHWSADSTRYTAYINITGKTASDGVNQIYVRGAEDNEFFECPYEKTRFRVQVQAAGSMATGFMAEAGMGKVELTWNNTENDFDDAMGFNVYRIGEPYQKVVGSDTTVVQDTLRLNREILPVDSTFYVDYDVLPGHTYNYYYKVLSTDLREYDVSNVVAATVLTSERGDANGSGAVDVADVITTVNYSVGDDPKPFLFEAADMNADRQIDVLDVVGIIEHILGRDSLAAAEAMAQATYTVENGTLYVESPVALAGVQATVALPADATPRATDALGGFEQASGRVGGDYIFLAYTLSGRTLPAGRHALLHLGEGELQSLCLSDAHGHNVEAIDAGEVNNIDQIDAEGAVPTGKATRGIYSVDGQFISPNAKTLKHLPRGVYIVNGRKVMKK